MCRYLQSLHRRAKRAEELSNSPALTGGSEDQDEAFNDVETFERVTEVLQLGEELHDHDHDDWEHDLSESPFSNRSAFVKDSRTSKDQWGKTAHVCLEKRH